MFILLVKPFVCDMRICISLIPHYYCLLVFSGNKDTEADSHSSKENFGTFSRVFCQSQKKCFALFSCLSAFILFLGYYVPCDWSICNFYST